MYVCKEMVIIFPPPKSVAINCNTKNNKRKIHTIHVNKTNLTIYTSKFQHSAHLVLYIEERCVKSIMYKYNGIRKIH